MRMIVTLALVMVVGGYRVAEGQTSMEMQTATEMERDARDFLGLEWGAGVGVMGAFGGDTAIEKASIVTVGQGDTARRIVYVEEEGDLQPRVFLEMHTFLWGDTVGQWRNYQQEKAAYQMDMAQRRAREDQTSMDRSGNNPESQTGKDQKTRDAEGMGEGGQATEGQARAWPRMPDPPLWGVGPFIALQSSDNKAVDAFTFGLMWGIRKGPKASNSVNIGFGLSFDPSVQVLAKDFKEGNAPPNGETAVRFKKEGRFGWAVMTSFTF